MQWKLEYCDASTELVLPQAHLFRAGRENRSLPGGPQPHPQVRSKTDKLVRNLMKLVLDSENGTRKVKSNENIPNLMIFFAGYKGYRSNAQ